VSLNRSPVEATAEIGLRLVRRPSNGQGEFR
jgi:hypothetical protein